MPVLIPANYETNENEKIYETNCEIFFNNSEVESNDSKTIDLLIEANTNKNNQIIEQSSKKEDISSPRVTSTVDGTDFIDKDETLNNDKIQVDNKMCNEKNEELLFAVTSSMNLTELAERLYSNIDTEQVIIFFIIYL